MYSSFYGLQIATRALSTNQAALDITGHNISNANTKGYTRQLANIQAATPLTLKASGRDMTLGAGSTLNSIQRARDNYIDRQFRWETSKHEYWAERGKALELIEGSMNEPSKYSLHNDLDGFWNSWSDLANNPQNSGARSVLIEKAMTLSDSFHHINQQLVDLKSDLDASVSLIINKINDIAGQIKTLNVQIKRAEVARDNPNDLKDSRDALVDELSKLVPVRVVETQDPTFTDRIVGNFKVIIGNDADPANVLVDDQAVRYLVYPPPNLNNVSQVVWADHAFVQGNTLGTTTDASGLSTVSLEIDGVAYNNIDLTSVAAVGTYGTAPNTYDVLATNLTNAIRAHNPADPVLANVEVSFQSGKLVLSSGTTGQSSSIEFLDGGGAILGFSNGMSGDNYVDLGSEMGTLKANMEIRDIFIEDYRGELDQMVKSLAQAVNTIHSSVNPPAINFFTDQNGTTTDIDISTIKLNEAIKLDPSKIITGAVGEVGDTGIALKIASLSQGWKGLLAIDSTSTIPTNLGSSSIGDYYGAMISKLGVNVQQAERMSEGQSVLVNYLENQRESLSGVSLDEEMTNLIRFQKSYGAAARVVTILDSLFDKILGMGMTR